METKPLSSAEKRGDEQASKGNYLSASNEYCSDLSTNYQSVDKLIELIHKHLDKLEGFGNI